MSYFTYKMEELLPDVKVICPAVGSGNGGNMLIIYEILRCQDIFWLNEDIVLEHVLSLHVLEPNLQSKAVSILHIQQMEAPVRGVRPSQPQFIVCVECNHCKEC